MSAKSQRLGRIEGEMQRVLSTLVSREVRDPRVGNVTITAVSVAPDMSTARIFFVPFASKHTPEEVTRRTESRRGFPARRRSDVRCRCATLPSSSSSTTSRSRTPTSSRASSTAR